MLSVDALSLIPHLHTPPHPTTPPPHTHFTITRSRFPHFSTSSHDLNCSSYCAQQITLLVELAHLVMTTVFASVSPSAVWFSGAPLHSRLWLLLRYHWALGVILRRTENKHMWVINRDACVPLQPFKCGLSEAKLIVFCWLGFDALYLQLFLYKTIMFYCSSRCTLP